MEIESLKTLYKSRHESRQFLRWLRDCEKSFSTLGVSYAEEQTGIDYYELVSIFKEMDMNDIGDFIVGRKGHDSRIVWKYDTKIIGEVAAGDGITFFQHLAEVPYDAIEAVSSPSPKNKISKLKHSFNLRKNFIVELELPDDFDLDDLTRLKNWLDLLVY